MARRLGRAAVTSLLFNLGKLGLGLYIGKSAVASSYGAAGSILVLLLWVYYSGLIFYFGGVITKVYADSYGSRRAVRATHDDIAQLNHKSTFSFANRLMARICRRGKGGTTARFGLWKSPPTIPLISNSSPPFTTETYRRLSVKRRPETPA